MSNRHYEYVDHTADIIVHAWGRTLKEAFQNGVKGMFGYMTDLDKIEEKTSLIVEARFEPEMTKEEMLFRVLDECLYQFNVQEYFVIKRLDIKELDHKGFAAVGYGETMDLKKHTQGTEVKAITMHGLSIAVADTRVDLHFLLDI